MKKLVFILPFLLALVCCKAQQNTAPTTYGNPVYLLKWLKVKDSIRASIYLQNTNDTLATRAYARGFAGGSIGQGYGIKVSGSTVSIDSANFRKVDSLYPVTDSTFILKINGHSYSYKMRGAVFSFNGRLGAVVPVENDYAQYYPKLDSAYADPSWIQSLNWLKLINLPTTLQTFGITNGVTNGGGAYQWIADIEANRPPNPTNGTFFLGLDDSTIRYYNGLRYITVATGIGGPDSVYKFNYGLLTTRVGDTVKVTVDTTTLKAVFGASSGGIVQIYTRYGLRITGSDTATVDTAIFMRWTDTTSTLPSRSWVLSRGFLTSETDPVATAKTVNISGTSSRGINVAGTASQTLGSNPTYVFTLDTTYAATLFALKDTAQVLRALIGSGGPGITQVYNKYGTIIAGGDSISVDTTLFPRYKDTLTGPLATRTYVTGRGYLTTESDPIAIAKTITITGTSGKGINVAGLAGQTVGSNPTWTFTLDTAFAATRWYVGQQGFLTTETDPVATAKTVTLNQTAGAGILVSGTAGQTVGANPTWGLKADTSVLSTKFALADTASILRNLITTKATTVYNKYGTVIASGDSITVDTTLFPRYKDTLSGPLATRTYVTSRGYLTTETDPVAMVALGDTAAALRAVDTIVLPGYGLLPSYSGLKKTLILDTTGTTIHGQGYLDARYVKRTDSFHVNIIKQGRGINPLWGHDTTLVPHGILDSGGYTHLSLAGDSTLVIYTPPPSPVAMKNETQVILTNNTVGDGNSIMYGYPTGTSFLTQIFDTLGITSGSNRAVTNSTVDDVLSRQFAGDPAGDVIWSYLLMMGENNFGEDTSNIKQNAIREGLRAAIANHFMDTAWAISNAVITKTGSWSNLSAANLISKSLAKSMGNPMYSSTAGNTLTATVYDNNVVIGTYGYKSTSSYGSAAITIDGVTQVNPMTGTTVWSGSNMCTNFTSQIGTYDPRQPIVWVFTGLGIGPHTVVITLLQNLETDFDYIGKMVQPTKALSMMVFHVTKRTPAGYFAYSAVGGGPAGIDSINRNIDTVCNFFRRLGLPLATVATNEWLNGNSYGPDGLHFTVGGEIQIAQAGLTRVSRAFQITGDTATTTSIGLETPTDKIMLSHPLTFKRAYFSTSSDSAAYANGDTLLFRGRFPGWGMKASPKDALDSFGYDVDTSKVTTLSHLTTSLSIYAPLTSPAFTGVPTGPTASGGTNTTQFATTAFVQAALPSLSGYAPLASPTFTGIPSGPTASGGTNTTQFATTAFVQAAIPSLTGYAPLASPTFTGVPAVPTATGGTNTTQAASTAFVQAALGSYASLASPALTGTPTAPTAGSSTNNTQIATTAFVNTAAQNAQNGAVSTVISSFTAPPYNGIFYSAPSTITTLAANTTAAKLFLTETGTGSASNPPAWSSIAESDVTNLSTDLAAKAPLASPTFTGTPVAPTASTGTNTTQVATTAFANAAATAAANALPNAFTGWQSVTASGTTAITKAFVSCAPSSSVSMTLTLPTSPVDGQTVNIYIGNGIGPAAVTLTISTTGSSYGLCYQGNNGVTSIGGSAYNRGSHFSLIFSNATQQWYVTSQTY